MFANGKWKESSQRYDCILSNFVLHVAMCSELDTDEFSYNTYKAYLQYLYTDGVSMSPEEAVGKFVLFIKTGYDV